MQKRRGISLIVLVITIIVMVILAGAIVLTLNNSGIIDRASEAVEQSNLATVKELAQIAWAEAYANGARTQEELEGAVNRILETNKIDKTKYTIQITVNGIEVTENKSEISIWVQQGTIVTNGTLTLNVGDNIDYNETASVETDVTWKVLGASEKGELLIMSDKDVDVISLTAEEGYISGIETLNDACKMYGNGRGAIDVRSIQLEDINRITGYVPGENIYENEVSAYGNVVTFSWEGAVYEDSNTLVPSYTSSNGAAGDCYISFRTMYVFDGNEFSFSSGEEASASNPQFITKIINNECNYVVKLANTSKAYKILFDFPEYWLATRCQNVGTDSIYYKMQYISSEGVESKEFIISGEGPSDRGAELGVRAVVTLAQDIQLKGSSETGWTY